MEKKKAANEAAQGTLRAMQVSAAQSLLEKRKAILNKHTSHAVGTKSWTTKSQPPATVDHKAAAHAHKDDKSKTLQNNAMYSKMLADAEDAKGSHAGKHHRIGYTKPESQLGKEDEGKAIDGKESKPLPYNPEDYKKEMMKKTLELKLMTTSPKPAHSELPSVNLKRRHSHEGSANEKTAPNQNADGQSTHQQHGFGHGTTSHPRRASEDDFQKILKKDPHLIEHIKDAPHEDVTTDPLDIYGHKQVRHHSLPLLSAHTSEENVLSYDKNNIAANFGQPVTFNKSQQKPAGKPATSDPFHAYMIKKLERPSKLNVIYSRKPTKAKIVLGLNPVRARKLFGNESRLGRGRIQVILRLLREETRKSESDQRTRSITSESSHCPDLSFLREYTQADLMVRPDYGETMPPRVRKAATSKLFSSLGSLWYFMIVTGRMPFCGGISDKTGLLELKLVRKSWRFFLFSLTSMLIFLVMMSSLTATFLIYDEYAMCLAQDKIILASLQEGAKAGFNSTVPPYLKLEALHLEKHWLPYTIMMCFFAFTTICNVSVIVYGQSMATVLSDVINCCVRFQVDGSKWIWTGCLTSLLLATSVVIFKTVMFIQRYTVTEWEANGYLTISTLRFVPSLRYLRTNLNIFPIYAPFFFVIQLYTILASYFNIILPAVTAYFIYNMAAHWNFRLALILGKIRATTKALKFIKSQLNYDFMFKYHTLIRVQVHYYSSQAFATVLTAFFAVLVFEICAILFRMATLAGISFDQRKNGSIAELPDSAVEFVNIKYRESPSDVGIDLCTEMWISFGALILVAELLGRVGYTIMEGGFFHLRRHGLLSCRSFHERRFVISLYQSLSPTNPIVIAPGNSFRINRRFIITIIETIMIIFTTMIQAQRSVLLLSPIYGLCDNKEICIVGYGSSSRNGGPNIWNKGAEALQEQARSMVQAPPPPPPLFIENAPGALAFPNTPTSRFFKRCRGTDITRQVTYTYIEASKTFVEYPIPTDPVACIYNAYATHKKKSSPPLYDAFGNLILASEIDDCGIPKLPTIGSYQSTVGIGGTSTKDRSDKETVTLRNP